MTRLIYILLFALLAADAYAFEPCRIKGYAHALECQTIKVNQFNVKVYKMASVVRYPLAEPLVWIPGDLGVEVSRAAAGKIRALRRIRTHQDLIWLQILDENQQPWLRCQPNSKPSGDVLPIIERIDHFADDAFRQQCHAQISQWGIEKFSNVQLAQLYEAVRKALAYEQVVIFADGYGANIALEWQKMADGIIQFQVFDDPPTLTHALSHSAKKINARFEAYRKACLENASCAEAYGDAVVHLQSVVGQLPKEISVQDPLTGKLEKIIMTESLLYRSLSQLLSGSITARLLPKILYEADLGQWQLFFGSLGMWWSKRNSPFNDAAFLAQYCLTFSDHANDQADEDSWFHQGAKQRYHKLCHPLNVQRKVDRKFTVNDVPTLLLKSGLSGDNNEWVSLTHRTEVHVPNAIGNLLGYGCAKDVIYRYFKWRRKHNGQPVMNAEQLNAGCVESIPLPAMDVLQ